MFRIKTDIRQFNCETQEKVEKLIRSWVIRPTDLIYLPDPKAWSPIGDHPDFEPLFHVMREPEGQASAPGLLEASDAAFSPPPEDDPQEEDVQAAGILSGLGKFKRPASALPIPQAPAGVEPVTVDGEVTMMTDRTAEFLGIDDEAAGFAGDDDEEDRETGEQRASLPPPPAAPVGIEPTVKSEEQTAVFMKDLHEEGDSDPQAQEDPSPFREAKEATPSLAWSDSVGEDVPSLESGTEVEAVPRVGRHDLPEEFFLTNELHAPVKKDTLFDELAKAKESPATEGIDDNPLYDDRSDPEDLLPQGQDSDPWGEVSRDLDEVISSVESAHESEVMTQDEPPQESVRETIELEPFELGTLESEPSEPQVQPLAKDLPTPPLVSAVELSEPSEPLNPLRRRSWNPSLRIPTRRLTAIPTLFRTQISSQRATPWPWRSRWDRLQKTKPTAYAEAP